MKIGIDIGGSHIGVGLVNDMGKVLLKKERDIKKEEKLQQIDTEKLLIETIVKFINEILNETSIQIHDIENIGIASPGTVGSGFIISSSNLGIENFNIVGELEKYYDIPIKIRNDAKCAAIAESEYGALKEYKSAVFLTIGTGIGGAVLWDGKWLEPEKYPGFEVGHMIIDKNGKQCNCGNKGCFETYGSIRALKGMLYEKCNITEFSGKQIREFIENNIEDRVVKEIINDDFMYCLTLTKEFKRYSINVFISKKD